MLLPQLLAAAAAAAAGGWAGGLPAPPPALAAYGRRYWEAMARGTGEPYALDANPRDPLVDPLDTGGGGASRPSSSGEGGGEGAAVRRAARVWRGCGEVSSDGAWSGAPLDELARGYAAAQLNQMNQVRSGRCRRRGVAAGVSFAFPTPAQLCCRAVLSLILPLQMQVLPHRTPCISSFCPHRCC